MAFTEKEIRTVEMIINSTQAQERLKDLQTRLETLRKKKDEALNTGNADALKAYTAEIKRTEREMARITTRAQGIARVMQDVDSATPKQLRNTIREINRELSSGAVTRGSEQWRALQRTLAEAQRSLRMISEEQRAMTQTMGDRLSAFGTKWFGLTTIVTQVTGAYDRLRDYVLQNVTAYAQLAEHFADVSKYTGMTRDEVRELNEEFDRLNTRTSREALNDLAADAGRLGITAKGDVMEFVEAANMINVALGSDLGEGAVKNIGKLAQLFGDADTMGLKQAMLATGSVINDLAQSSSASEGYIVDFTGRLAGMAKQAGMTQADVMGLAAVLDQAMVNSEEGSTALSKIIQKLYREPAKLAAAVGLDVKQFSETMKRDANEGLLQFARAAEQLGGLERLAPVLGDIDLTGAGVTKTLSALANNLGKVHTTQAQATAAFALGTSVVKEYNVANNTTQAELEKAQQRMNDLTAQLGERLTPMMTALTSTSSLLAQSLLFLIDHWRTLVTVGGAIVVYTGYLHAAQIATAALAVRTKAVAAAQRVWLALQGTGNLLLAAGARIVQGFAVVTNMSTVATKSATVAQRAWNTAVKANPVGLIVSVLTTAIALLWEYVAGADAAAEATVGQARKVNAVAEAHKKADDTAAAELERVRQLTQIVNSNTSSYEQKKSALLALERLVPNFHANLKKELGLTKDNVKAINDYTSAIKNRALAQAYQEEYTEIAKELVTAQRTLATKQNNLAAVDRELKKKTYSRGGVLLQYKLKDRAVEQERVNKAQAAYNELLRQQTQIDKEIAGNSELKKFFTALLTGATDEGGTGTGNTFTPTPTGNTAPTKDDPLKKAREAIEQEMKLAEEQMKHAYNMQWTTAHMMEHGLLQIEVEKYERLAQIQGLGEEDRLEFQNKAAEARRKLADYSKAWSLRQIETEQAEQQATLRAGYARGEMDEATYQSRLTDITLKGLLRRAEYLKKYGKPEEAKQAQAEYDKALEDVQIARMKDFEQRVNAVREEYLKKPKAEQKADELAFLDELHKKKLLSEEEYQKARREVEMKYTEDVAVQTDPLSSALMSATKALRTLQTELKDGKATWQTWANAGLASFSVVTAGMQAMQQLHQANQQIEVNETNRAYDAQIKRVGANTKRGKKLEEEKQREVAKIKTKYAKKQSTMQVAQAVADTATNAIKAYQAMAGIPMVGPALGAAAAAAAVAFGGIQIATIRKQAQAQQEGYYKGGYTGGRNYRRAAGVVHEGEFVASHQAVNNPALAPVFTLLDQAQRRGSVASLTADDVSRSLIAPAVTATHASTMATRATAPAVAAAPSMAPLADLAPVTAATGDALRRLSDQLDRGIEAYVTLDGPQGLDRQWRHYQRLNGRR